MSDELNYNPLDLLAYMQWNSRMDGLTNEELVIEYLRIASPFGRANELGTKLCERLVPGIIERLAEQGENATPQTKASP